MTRDRNYSLKRLIALGALGRRFESCRPDSLNPSRREESQPLFFIVCSISDEKGALEGALISSKIY